MSVAQAQAEAAAIAGALGFLSDVAISVSRGDDADTVFADLVEGIRTALEADRVSLLVLDDSGRLAPTTSSAKSPNGELYQRFLAMHPIPVEAVASGWETLREQRVVLVPDATSHPLVPAAWQRQFDLSDLALVPLRARDEPVGLLAVEGGGASRLDSAQRSLLEGCAALAGIVVHGLTNATRDATHVLAAARDVQEARTISLAAERALDSLLSYAGGTGGALALLHREHFDVLAARGIDTVRLGMQPVTDLPPKICSTCHEAWRVDATKVVTCLDETRQVAIIPLPRGDRVLGVVVLTSPALSQAAVARVSAFAPVLALALAERYAAHQRELESELSWRISEWSVQQLAPADVYVELMDVVPKLAGIRLLDAVAATRSIARDTGLRPASTQWRRLLAQWRRRSTAAIAKADCGRWVIPVSAKGSTVAALIADRAPGTRTESDRVHKLVGGLAASISRALDEAAATRAEPVLAAAAARAQFARRCYEETGLVLSHLAVELRPPHRGAAAVPVTGERLLDEARSLIADASNSLTEQAVPRQSLRRSIERLTQRLEARGAPPFVLKVEGRAPDVPAAAQIALLRALRDAVNLFRTTRVGLVHGVLTGDPVILSLRPDAVLGSLYESESRSTFTALRRMRGWLAPFGGRVDFANDSGVPVLTLTLPTFEGSPLITTVARGTHSQGKRPAAESTPPTSGSGTTGRSCAVSSLPVQIGPI